MDKKHQQMLKLADENWWEKGYLHSLEIPPHKIPINSNFTDFTVKKAHTHHGTDQHHAPLWVHWDGHSISSEELAPKMDSPILIMRKYQKNPNWGEPSQGQYHERQKEAWQTPQI